MFQILLLIARAIGLAFSAAGAGARFGQTIAATDMLAPRYPDEIVVRVQAGWTTYKHPKNPKYELGGYFPDILLWDEEGELIGIGHGRKRKIADGEGQDIFITPTPGNPGGLHQAEYLSVNANRNDNICISAIHVKQPNGADLVLTGDIPAGICGYHGYSESLTKIKLSEGHYRPHCFWMTGNEDNNDKFPQSVVFHLPDFLGYGNHTSAADGDNAAICAVQPRLWKYDHWPKVFPIFWPPLVYPPIVDDPTIPTGLLDVQEWNYLDVNYLQNSSNWLNKSDSSPWKRGQNGPKRHSVDLSVFKGEADKNVVQERGPASPRERHFYRNGKMHDVTVGASVSARYACENPNMIGPDVLSHKEQLYCDLDTHTLYTFCEREANNKEACFDEEKMELVGEEADEGSDVFVQLMASDAGLSQSFTKPRLVRKKLVSPLNVDEAD